MEPIKTPRKMSNVTHPKRVPLYLTEEERTLLDRIAKRRKKPAAAAVRELLWEEGARAGLLELRPSDDAV